MRSTNTSQTASQPSGPSGANAPDANSLVLTRLFESHVDMIFGFVYARCGSRSIAEEVSSETFAEAARVAALGRADELGKGWLIHVARLRLIDYWRKAERQRRKVDRLRMQPINGEVDPFQESLDRLAFDALDSLSQRQRAALVLRYLDDFSVSEVAAAMQLSYPATESLLARARRSLLAAYEKSDS